MTETSTVSALRFEMNTSEMNVPLAPADMARGRDVDLVGSAEVARECTGRRRASAPRRRQLLH